MLEEPVGQLRDASPWQPIIDEIRAHHRTRCFAMEMRKRSDLALGAWLRSQLGWRRDLPAEERNEIAACAKEIIACGEKVANGKRHQLENDDEYRSVADVVQASLLSRGPWDAVEGSATKRMADLAAQLPIWKQFGEPIRGFGLVSLAVIIGECGDIGNYRSHSALWKRCGLAVLNGVRQGGLPKSAKAEEWIAHGYNRQRRSRIYVIGDVLVKSNGDGRYRTAYLRRKKYECDRAEANGLIVAPSAKIPAKQASKYMSHGHIDNRARRYMEKLLLRDLWKAWRVTSENT